MAQFDMSLLEKTDSRVEQHRGRMYRVILVNDETTPMDVVTVILMAVFEKSGDDAVNLMMTAHLNGKAVIDRMPKKLAIAKQQQAMSLASEFGYSDFTIKLEEEEE